MNCMYPTGEKNKNETVLGEKLLITNNAPNTYSQQIQGREVAWLRTELQITRAKEAASGSYEKTIEGIVRKRDTPEA